MSEENSVEQVSLPAEETATQDVNQTESVEQSQEKQEQYEQKQEVIDVSNVDPSFPVSGAGNNPVEDELDEKGVPYKNRFHEYKRKFEDTTTQLSEIRDMVSSLTQSQQQALQAQKETQPEYTIEDLEAYKQQHPEHAGAVEQEKARIIREQTVATVRQEFEQQAQMQQAAQIKQQSLQAVALSFPDAFAKDANGNVTGWDQNSPITQRIMQYGKDPAIANRPDGLLFAAKLAAGDLYAQGLQESQGIIAKQQAQVGTLQRKTAIEGSSGTPATASQRSQAMKSLRETGSRDAGRAFLRNMFTGS